MTEGNGHDSSPAYISADTTVALIAAKLSLQPEQVRDALRQLSTELHGQTEEHPHILIDGLGTLARDATGLNFHPSAELESLVNGEYASLVPVRLDQGPAAPTLAADATSNRKGQRLKTILLTSLIIIGIQAAVFLVLQQTGFWDGNNTREPTLTVEQPSVNTEYQDEVAETAAAGNIEEADTVVTEIPMETETTIEPETSGENPGFDLEIGGYAIILASFEGAATALNEAARFRDIIADPSLPVGVVRTLSEDSEYFRVYVGQMPAVGEAVNLREQLTGLPADAWIIRLGAGSQVIQ